MDSRLLLALVTFALPALADDRMFRQIHEKDTITLVLPAGSCKASVVGRDLDGITVRLKSTTTVCGKGKSLATLSRSDVRDVVDDRRARVYGPGGSRAGQCAVLAATLAAVTAGFAIGELTGSNAGVVSVIGASGAAGAFLCRSRDPRYTVFTDRIVPTP